MAGWKDIVGHKDVIRYMEKAIQEGAPSHAYIISGAQGAGKQLLARTFAMGLTCEAEKNKPCMECHACTQAIAGSQPDIIWVRHEKPKTISVDDIRKQVVEDITIRPYACPYKVYVIPEAEKMNEQAQNALLKTLEEPPEYGVILLLTTNPEALLPTVQSRCVLLKLRNLKDSLVRRYLTENMELDEEKAALCTAFAQGSLGKAIMLAKSEHFNDIRMDAVRLMKKIHTMNMVEIVEELKNITTYKLEVQDYLDIIAVWYRDVLMFKATNDVDQLVFRDELRAIRETAGKSSYEGVEMILEALKKAQERLKANVNFDLTMELLLLTIKEN